jgi:uncharacterized protein (DUF697 family)
MDRIARRITNLTSGVAAATAFVAQPVPALDELAIVPIHYYLVMRLAKERGVSVFKIPWRNVGRVIWYGAAARFLTHITVGLVPVAGGVTTALTAVALTEYLSRYLDEVLADPAHARPPELSLDALRALYDRAVAKVTHREPTPTATAVASPTGPAVVGGAA